MHLLSCSTQFKVSDIPTYRVRHFLRKEPSVGSVAQCALHSIFDFGAIYIVCLFILYASPLILFSSLFFPYLPHLLSFPLRIDPLRFPAGCRKR